MSHFLDSVSIIISTFCKHAKEDGDQSKLSRRRMKEFIQKEFADAIANPHDPQTIDKILQFLEWDGDGEIDFNEFLLLVFRVAKACYWYLQKGPCLLQKTKLVTSGKILQEPEIKNRGSHRQLQEEEPQTRETNRHPPCKPEPQRETRIQELETLEETESHHQQRTTQSRDDAKRSTRTRELIPQVHEKRSQEPSDQCNRQRRRQPPEQDRLEDLQHRKCGSSKARQPGPWVDERQNREGPQTEELADVKSHRHPCEPKLLPDQWSGHQPREPAIPAYDQRNHEPQNQQAVANGGRRSWPHEPKEADRRSHNWPRKHELLTEERSRYHLRELEQKELEQSSRQPCEPECLDSERPHQSYIEEPLELDKRYFEKCEQNEPDYEEEKEKEDETEYRETQRRRYQDQRSEEQHDADRNDRQLRTQQEGYESERTLRREYEQDGRRRHEAVRYERTRETTEVS
uniref:EF-hand domain-containing protein n=3 Tax=Anas platyrhynchos TaxID=8839 RepID=A0A493T4W8_ANAPP